MNTEVKARWTFIPPEFKPAIHRGRVICSECGEAVLTTVSEPPEYCHRCKARMVIPEADFEAYLESLGEFEAIKSLTRKAFEEKGMVEHGEHI